MTTLQAILTGIDWAANINTSLGSGTTVAKIDQAAHRIAVWSLQLEQADTDNPALCFVREMQQSIQHSGALIGLCLYKPSAASSRTLVESCVYYTYFRTHHEELATLVVNPKYYVSKNEIIEYHSLHTTSFKSRQVTLNLIARLQGWYSRTSSIVHGQIPGAWNTHADLAQTCYSKEVQDLALSTLLDGVSIVNDLLLCTVAKQLWKSFAPDAKKFLTKGMAAATRQALNLDSR